MDTDWRPMQGSNPPAGVDPNSSDWRAQLQPETRNRIVRRILETLPPVSRPMGLNELQRNAMRLEEEIYTAATNQSDYWREICMKMLSMETMPEQAPGNSQVIPNQNNPGQASADNSAQTGLAGVGNWQEEIYQMEQQALHYELNKNISLQRRVTLSQADEIQACKDTIADLEKQLAEAQASSLATASSELESLRSSYKDLETKLLEADQKRETAEKQQKEKNSEFLRKEGEFALKRKNDSETIQTLQKEVNGLRKYMNTAEKAWDVLNADVFEPLGYNEERRNEVPRDDLIRLAGDDCRDLISASRKVCHNLNIKDSRTCDINELIKRMDMLPEIVVDLQASSARGAAQMSLAMCLARSPGLDIDLATTGVPPNTDVDALLDACSGYDTRIARRIRHDEFFEKVVLPADEVLEAEYAKERAAETRPTGSGEEGQMTWTSSKDKSKDGATSPTEEAEDDDDDAASSPTKETEDEAARTEEGTSSSPAKEK